MRQNNFNLVRMAAAFAVLVSHSFALVGDAQPAIHGVRLGAFAVDVFFVTSGYLITASLMRRSAVEFVAARLLRIYPALIVAVTLTVLCAHAYTGVIDWNYWVRNALLIPGAPGEIAGVFTDNPVKGVNGSLWTLPYEVRMYAAVFVLWIVARRWFKFTTPLVAVAALAFATTTLGHLGWMFFAGAVCQVFAVRNDGRIALALAAVLALATIDHKGFGFAYLLALPYLTLYVAGLPGPQLAYNRLGDYSYGVYIYAFPVQQIFVALGVASVVGVFATASIVTLALAVASWHLVEKRALRLKSHAGAVKYECWPSAMSAATRVLKAVSSRLRND